jgi:hypothetical protein
MYLAYLVLPYPEKPLVKAHPPLGEQLNNTNDRAKPRMNHLICFMLIAILMRTADHIEG